ncbi:MAG: hypothetical protein H6822_28420 [Planctomycetaceae bacterium]|nr:hypothetical protein [Planctomycetales bacterium]MCB9926107.1 hypothetical protein [Planctomycetaceae bacterium]
MGHLLQSNRRRHDSRHCLFSLADRQYEQRPVTDDVPQSVEQLKLAELHAED